MDKANNFKIGRAFGSLAHNVDLMKMLINLYSFDGHQSAPENIKEIKSSFVKAFEEQRGYVAFNNEDNPIGYITWNLTPNSKWVKDSVFISELYVNKDYRKKGIGKKLVEHVLQTNFPKSYKSFWLTHAPEECILKPFYESLGFKDTSVTDVGNIIMTKKID